MDDSVPAGGGLPQLLRGRAAQSRGGGLRRGRRAVGGLLLAGAPLDLHRLGHGAAAAAARHARRRTATVVVVVATGFLSVATLVLIVLFFGDYVSVICSGLVRAGLRTGQGPSARPRPLLGLEIRIYLHVRGGLVAVAVARRRRLSHVNHDISPRFAQRGYKRKKSLGSHSINVAVQPSEERVCIYYARYARRPTPQARVRVSVPPREASIQQHAELIGTDRY
ncbi:hypothetical protein EYF80_011491 [Liparis tanakae]|uniref:Uncharacterized protein n=1 Tax=Liparis tanakae TaxID=230148 RepID=A0A4Z2IKF3_9TELE|nr:hypothetical protein EYF80_011491 [Liparis tanakae]